MRLSVGLLLAVSGWAQSLPLGRVPLGGAAAVMPVMLSKACSSGDSANSTSVTVDSTGGSLIVIALAGATPYNVTVSDAVGGHNNGAASAIYTGGSFDANMYYFQAPVYTGSGHVVTIAGTPINSGMCVYVFSHMATSGVFESPYTRQSASGNTNTPNAITPSGSGYHVFVSVVYMSTTDTVTVDSGFATRDYVSGGFTFPLAASYLIQAGAAAQNPLWSFGTSQSTVALMAVFKGE